VFKLETEFLVEAENVAVATRMAKKWVRSVGMVAGYDRVGGRYSIDSMSETVKLAKRL
jgi:hypothetical protein